MAIRNNAIKLAKENVKFFDNIYYFPPKVKHKTFIEGWQITYT